MEPAEYRPDDGGPGLCPWPVRGAAMEPAEYRPDDVTSRRWRENDEWPQWSRPSIGRMTSGRECWRSRRRRAAMEPAEYRPDDVLSFFEFDAEMPAAMEPAEYRPDDGEPGFLPCGP